MQSHKDTYAHINGILAIFSIGNSLPYPTLTICRRVRTYAWSITWQPNGKEVDHNLWVWEPRYKLNWLFKTRLGPVDSTIIYFLPVLGVNAYLDIKLPESIPYLFAGEKKSFYCFVQGRPPPTVKWLKNNTILKERKSLVQQVNLTLDFSELELHHTGNYTCEASQNSSTKSRTILVTISCKHLLLTRLLSFRGNQFTFEPFIVPLSMFVCFFFPAPSRTGFFFLEINHFIHFTQQVHQQYPS